MVYGWGLSICLTTVIFNTRQSTKCFHQISLASCLCFSSCFCDNFLQQKQLREEWIHPGSQLRVQSILVGRSRQQELEAAGHVSPTVRSRGRGMRTVAQLPFSILQGFQDPSQGNGNTYSGPVFLPQCNKDDPPQAYIQAHLPGSLNFIYLLFMCMSV